MRKFYTAQDVAFCASRGETAIAINRCDVVTSVAKEEAEKKGICFVYADEAVKCGAPLGPQMPLTQQTPLGPQMPLTPQTPLGPQAPLTQQTSLGPQTPLTQQTWIALPFTQRTTSGPPVPIAPPLAVQARPSAALAQNVAACGTIAEPVLSEWGHKASPSAELMVAAARDRGAVKVKALPYRGLITEDEVDHWRADFPILSKVVHLGNCSQSAQSKRVIGGLNRYLENWGGVGMDWDSWCEEVDAAKAEFAKIINADPEEIAVAASVSDLVSSIANALDYTGKRKKVVVTDAEFPTVDHIWLANQRHGALVDFIPVNEEHQIDIAEYDKHIDENTLLTSVTQVYYLNGFKQDIGAIAGKAHEKGSLILVDAYQSLGTDPVDVKKMGIDILVSGCLKYLFGVPGIAFMYVNRDLVHQLKPSVTGWFGQTNPFLFQTRYNDWSSTASRFDTGTPPVMTAYAVKAGMEIINEVEPGRIKDRIDMLSAHALQGCLDRGLETISPFDVSQKGGTTAVVCGHKVDSHTMEKLLRERNVIGSGRGDVIRLAPHFYSKPEEIDYALDRIKEILDGR